MMPNQTGILRVKDGEAIVDTYVWQHDDVPLPGDHQLIIYELHVGDFFWRRGRCLSQGQI